MQENPGKNDPRRNRSVEELEKDLTATDMRIKKEFATYQKVWKFLRALGFNIEIKQKYSTNTYEAELTNWLAMKEKVYTRQQLVDAWPGGWFSRRRLKDGEEFEWRFGSSLHLHFHDGYWWFDKT